MKIAFLGDSITEGTLGVSFVDIIEKRLPEFHFINYGIGGDTVGSLYKRIRKMDNLNTFDVFVLFIGINDVFGKLNLQHKLIKVLSNQSTAKNNVTFKKTYNDLLQYLLSYNKKILIIPPLLLGEDVTNRWNQQVKQLADIVKEQANFYKTVRFIDLRNIFVERLENKKISNYLPMKLVSIKKDVDTLKTDPIIDSKSKERGLHLTLDGVHINSIGANIIAREIIFELQRLK
jgi:lysophospholipase L1-like esterase